MIVTLVSAVGALSMRVCHSSNFRPIVLRAAFSGLLLGCCLTGCQQPAQSPLAELNTDHPVQADFALVEDVVLDGDPLPADGLIRLRPGQTKEFTGTLRLVDPKNWPSLVQTRRQPDGQFEFRQPTRANSGRIDVFAFLLEEGDDGRKIFKPEETLVELWDEGVPPGKTPEAVGFKHRLKAPTRPGTYVFDIRVFHAEKGPAVPPVVRPIFRREVIVE